MKVRVTKILKKIKIMAKITLGLLAKGNAALRALGNDKGANTRGTRSMGVYAESFLKEIFTDRKNRKEDKKSIFAKLKNKLVKNDYRDSILLLLSRRS